MIQGLLHFIWLGGAPSYASLVGMREWAKVCLPSPPQECIAPILWIDELAFRQMLTDTKNYNFFTSTTPPIPRIEHLLICGHIQGHSPVPILIAHFNQNLPSINAILTRTIKDQLNPHQVTNIVNAILAESNLAEGGAPMLASDMLRLLILRAYGGIYIDTIGIEPKIIPLTISAVENLVLNQAHTKDKTSLTPAGLVTSGDENFGFIVDINAPGVKTCLTSVLSKYSDYYRTTPQRGIMRRCQIWGNQMGFMESMGGLGPRLLQAYISALQKFRDTLQSASIQEVSEIHTKRPVGHITGWYDRSRPEILVADAFEGAKSSEIAASPLYKNTEANAILFGVYECINAAGFHYLRDVAIPEYARQNNLDFNDVSNLGLKLFGTTPLKGRGICSYDHPLIGRARIYWQAANIIGNAFKKYNSRKSL